MPVHRTNKDQRLPSYWICHDCDKVIKAREVPRHHEKKHQVQHYNYDPRPVSKKKCLS